MKNVSNVLESILSEYNYRLGEENPYAIRDFYAFFAIDKRSTEEEKSRICKDLLFEALAYYEFKRNELANRYSIINHGHVVRYNEEKLPYDRIFVYAIPSAAAIISEEELLQLLAFLDQSSTIKHLASSKPMLISTFFIDLVALLDLVIYYQKYRPLSASIKQKLDQLKGIPSLSNDYYQKRISEVENASSPFRVFPEELDAKQLDATELSKAKKWQWIQNNPTNFIADRMSFYQLLDQLSKINRFNLPQITPEIRAILQSIDSDAYEVFVLDLYEEVRKEGNKRSKWFIGEKVIAFKIFVWLLFELKTKNRYALSIKLLEKCFTKIPRVGPTSRKLGDAILRILYESETIEGLGVLLNLKSRSKYPVFREALDASIKKAINYTKLNPNEIEDYFISDFDLQDGIISTAFLPYSSQIIIEDFNTVKLLWLKEDQSLQKSVPAKVKNDYTNELKLWKAKQKDIKKELSGQKQRLEGFWRKEKEWPFEVWKKHLLDHPLLRFLSRSLIWQFKEGDHSKTGIFHDDHIVNSNNEPLAQLENTVVSLWHPSKATIAQTQAWRFFILSHEIKQPFKQAFREVYIITDAEIATSTYSNRFLNHVVRHHKFAALAKQRLWNYASVYSSEAPTIEYKEFQVKARFDLVNNHDLATTGRVHFRDTKQNRAINMEDVPPIIFSESMRDVDLFVGVCSIGIEEEWNQNQHRNYWNNFSTAELSSIGKTRRDLLTNMIPKLKIREQCTLTDRFLVVKGQIRTYKIHLGSGNILMEPNDQYLCIVPDNKSNNRGNQIFLPFDDDATFSIILSKALLLAEDSKIKDPVILQQIKL